MVEPDHPQLTIQEQCRILSISRSAYYYAPEPKEDEREIVILQAIVEEWRQRPFYGYRKVWRAMQNLGVTLKQVRRIMKKAGLRAVYASKKTSLPANGHVRYPYLLKD